jgi:hypothetical protein
MTDDAEPPDGNAETRRVAVKPKTATASVTLADGADDPHPDEDGTEDTDE